MSERREGRPDPTGLQRQREPVTPLRVALVYLHCQVAAAGDEYSAVFTSEICKIILAELYEVHAKESTFSELVKQTALQLDAEQDRNVAYNAALREQGSLEQERPERLKPLLVDMMKTFKETSDGCDFLQRLHVLIDSQYFEAYNEGHKPEKQALLRSPLGIFMREMRLTLDLSFEATAKLSKQVMTWMSNPGPSHLLPVERLNRRTAVRDTLETRMLALETHQAAAAAGDYSQALTSLRKFYDYRFPKSGRGQHQHALLNLASYHYSTGGMEAARHAVDEAVKIARTEGDRECLQHCMSLLHRISMETASSSTLPTQANIIKQLPYSLSKIPPVATAKDDLWSIRLALDLGESVPDSFQRLYRAMGRHENALAHSDEPDTDAQAALGVPLDWRAWHGTQAALWDCLGVEAVTQFHQSLIDEEGDDEDARLSGIISGAQNKAKSGSLESALQTLMAASTVQHLTLQACQTWADAVWDILADDALNREDDVTLQVINMMRSPQGSIGRNGPGGPVRNRLQPSTKSGVGIRLAQEEVRSCLKQARKLQRSQAPTSVILPHVLAAVDLAGELGLWPLYRLANVMLAEALAPLDSAMAVREVGRVWTQVQQSGDKEALAIGASVLGRAELEHALERDQREFAMARSYLETALTAAEAIKLRSRQIEALGLLALLPDTPHQEADALAGQWQALCDQTHDPQSAERARKIGDVVQLVGVRIVERWE